MKATVNGHYDFNIEINNDVLKVNGIEVSIDSRQMRNGHTHVIYKNRSYNIELVSAEKSAKTSTFKVNGSLYTVAVEDHYDQLLKQLGMDNLQSNKVSEVKAPMPGLVLNISVKEGQEVNKGDSLLVLEAMKMENVIKSPTAGIVKKILVSKGNKVEKNEVLIQFQ